MIQWIRYQAQRGLSGVYGRPKIPVQDGVGIGAIEVVRVNNREGTLDKVTGGQNRLPGPPGFCPALRDRMPGGQVIQFLKGVINGDASFVSFTDRLAKGSFKIATDHKDNLPETGLHGIVDRIIQKRFAVGTHGIQLFETAIAAAHAGGKHEEGGCLHHRRDTLTNCQGMAMANQVPSGNPDFELREPRRFRRFREMAHLTCNFFSETLGVSTSMNVILPQAIGDGQIGMKGAKQRSRYPILYLLHGWSDDDSTWMRRTSIERYAADLGLAIIMPRVELSYYQNMGSGMRFWDFLADELPALCSQWFPISNKREETFAAGLSMGGYGAFRLGLSRPEQFGAVASLSGALDIADVWTQWEQDPLRRQKLEAIWGKDFGDFKPESDLLHLASELAASGMPQPRLYQWCGTGDFLYQQNLNFRDHAQATGLDLQYSEGPGDHSWEHWDREIQLVLNWLGIS